MEWEGSLYVPLLVTRGTESDTNASQCHGARGSPQTIKHSSLKRTQTRNDPRKMCQSVLCVYVLFRRRVETIPDRLCECERVNVTCETQTRWYVRGTRLNHAAYRE